MASASAVGTTPRPVRSNSGAPSCASSWRHGGSAWAAARPAARGAQQAAGVEHGQEAAHQGPVETVRGRGMGMRICIAPVPDRQLLQTTATVHTARPSTSHLEPHDPSHRTRARRRRPLRRRRRAGLCRRRLARAGAAAPRPAPAAAAGVEWIDLPLADTAALAARAAGAACRGARRQPDLHPLGRRAAAAVPAGPGRWRSAGRALHAAGQRLQLRRGMPALLDEDTPQRPDTRKGRTARGDGRRAAAPRRGRAGQRGDPRRRLLRRGSGTWIDLAIAKDIGCRAGWSTPARWTVCTPGPTCPTWHVPSSPWPATAATAAACGCTSRATR
jgi:hypothetical protein